MSTDLTTSLSRDDDHTGDALRFARASDGALRIYAAYGGIAPRRWRVDADDAIRLRDWLNDEWPVMQAEPVDECCAGDMSWSAHAAPEREVFVRPNESVRVTAAPPDVDYISTPWGLMPVGRYG